MKIMFIGALGSGKTTLIQSLNGMDIQYKKTQAVDYQGDYIDTPGEYMQVRCFWCGLTTVSHDADVICFVQDSSSDECWFSGGIAGKFSKPVIGVASKSDACSDETKIKQARRYLKLAGCRSIYTVSSFTGEGIGALHSGLQETYSEYKKELAVRCAKDYFD